MDVPRIRGASNGTFRCLLHDEANVQVSDPPEIDLQLAVRKPQRRQQQRSLIERDNRSELLQHSCHVLFTYQAGLSFQIRLHCPELPQAPSMGVPSEPSHREPTTPAQTPSRNPANAPQGIPRESSQGTHYGPEKMSRSIADLGKECRDNAGSGERDMCM